MVVGALLDILYVLGIERQIGFDATHKTSIVKYLW